MRSNLSKSFLLRAFTGGVEFPLVLFFVIVVQLLLFKSDQAIGPDSVPQTLPNSPFPIRIT